MSAVAEAVPAEPTALPLAAMYFPVYVFLSEFYVGTHGLSLAAIGTVFIAVRLFDAVSDPVVGVASDRILTRWGQRIWLGIGCPVVAVSAWMLFVPAEGGLMSEPTFSAGDETITIRIPFDIRKRGGRKLVLAPDGNPWAPTRARIDNAMIKALARAHRWRKLLETGAFATIEEIAAAEKINASYVSRILRLTMLAPDIVEAILDGRQPLGLTLPVLLRPFPVEWEEQRRVVCC